MPAWTERPRLWERVIEAVQQPAPTTQAVFIHRDFHPGNVLWVDDTVSGLIDWEPASWGPRNMDLAHCRLNLAQLHGAVAADAFLDAYRMVAGPFEHPAYFDLLAVIEMLPDVGPPYRGVATDHRPRLEEYLAGLVGRID